MVTKTPRRRQQPKTPSNGQDASAEDLAAMAPVTVAQPPSPSAVKPDVAEEPIGETPDSVELYLNEIARYKLLRAAIPGSYTFILPARLYQLLPARANGR